MHGQDQKEIFGKMEKNRYRNRQYLHLLSKGLRNLFPKLPEKLKSQIVFFPVPNMETPMEALSLILIDLFNQALLDFVLKMSQIFHNKRLVILSVLF